MEPHHPSSFVRIARRLERRGLLSLKPGIEDRRTRHVEITPEGLRALKVVYPQWRRAQDKVLEAFDGDRTDAAMTLQTLVQAATEEEA